MILDLFERTKRSLPAVQFGWFHSPVSTLLRQNTSAGCIIVDNQYLDPPQAFLFDRILRLGLRAAGEACCEVEGTAMTGFAFHPESPAHHGDQLRSDRQSQTGSAVAACSGSIRLGKGM